MVVFNYNFRMKINALYRRKQLKPRKHRYWQLVAKGRAVGFYRTADGGTWHARIQNGIWSPKGCTGEPLTGLHRKSGWLMRQ